MKPKKEMWISDTVRNNIKRLVAMGKDDVTIAIRCKYKLSFIQRVKEELGL